MNIEFEPTIVYKTYKLYLQIVSLLDKFPKRNRYTIGQKIDTEVLEILECMIQANQEIKNTKEIFLLKASSKVDVLKILFRICFDLKLIDERGYAGIEGELKEIGKMLGGWIKHSRAK